jgi:hypothetical protein
MKAAVLKQKRPDAIAMMSALTHSTANSAAPETPPPIRTRDRLKPKPGKRAGTRLVAGHFPEATFKALKHLMAEEDATLQALLEEAIHDLLVKKGMGKSLISRA